MEAVLEVVRSDRRKTLANIGLELQLSHSTVYQILRKDLKLRKKATKFIPKILTDAHKETRVRCCTQFLD